MADINPLGDEPRGNQTVIWIMVGAGVVFLLIFIALFTGIFNRNVQDRGNANTPPAANRANP